MQLLDTDRRILRILQEDARLSNQALAERVGMSASACWRRVKALEDAGLILRYPALLDPDKAGLAFNAIVHVALTRHDAGHVDTFVQAIAGRPDVVECYATTGEADYHLRVICADKDEYNRFLEQFLFRLPGIAHVRTNLVLRNIKLNGPLPV
jgi:Lrp/AsnC family transcriptional regulator, leucine-responsive regulatory protein